MDLIWHHRIWEWMSLAQAAHSRLESKIAWRQGILLLLAQTKTRAGSCFSTPVLSRRPSWWAWNNCPKGWYPWTSSWLLLISGWFVSRSAWSIKSLLEVFNWRFCNSSCTSPSSSPLCDCSCKNTPKSLVFKASWGNEFPRISARI